MKNKVIISCAITGGIHTPTLSDALPYTPSDIARQSIEAAQAGAAILHLHARDPQTGAPTGSPEVYKQFLPIIKQATDAVINLTTGGSPDMSPDDRLAAALAFSPEMCSLNMGSMNFSFHGMGAKVETWKFPWEKQYIADSEKFIFRNTFADIARNYELLSSHGTRFEHECYDIGHLYNLAHFVDKGRALPNRLSLYSQSLVFLAALAAILIMLYSCAAQLTGCLAMSMSGQRLGPENSRCLLLPRPQCWAAMSASGWKIVCLSSAVRWPQAMQSKCIK
jgi:uncharacterized protein (DUF849 family)